jgi:putative heme-binding domain-containing protein
MTSKKSPCLRLLAERSVSVLAALVLATGAARGEVPVTTDVVNAQDGEAGLCAGAEAVRRPRPLTSPTADELASGRRLFAAQCTRCHGQDGAGGSGPSLRVPRLRRAEDDAALVGVIMDGVPGTAMAAAWQLSDPEVVLVAAYVRSLGRTSAEAVAGDASRGRAIYEAKGACATCHVVAGRGGSLGPELTDIGSRRGASHLRQSLLEPAADFPHRTVPYEPGAYSAYRLVRAVPTTGAPVVGFAVNEDTFTLQLRDAGGALYSLRKADLARVENEPSATLMPSYKGVLTEREIQDLLAYLAGLRGEP